MATIQFKRGTTIPTGLTLGEPAWDYSNNRFYIGVTSSAVWVGAGITTGSIQNNSSNLIPTQSAVKTYFESTAATKNENYIIFPQPAAFSSDSERALTGGNHITILDGGAGKTASLIWNYDQTRGYYAFGDFIFAAATVTLPFFPNTAKSGTITNANEIQKPPYIGVASLNTQTSTSSRATISSSIYDLMYFGIGKMTFETMINIGLSASDATNSYTIRAGFIDTPSTTSIDGAYFEYSHSINGGKWSATTVSNSVKTNTDQINTGITAEVDTWYKLKVEANAAGTEVNYYINNSLVSGHTLNIPNADERRFGFGVSTQRSAGTVQRQNHIDYMLVRVEDPRP